MGKKIFGIITFLVLTLTAGCGFRPLNDTAFTKNTAKNIPPITLPNPKDKKAYLLKNELQRLLPGDRGNYSLSWAYKSTLTGISLNDSRNYTRYNRRYLISWNLINEQGQTIRSGNSATTIGTNILKAPYTTVAIRQDADRQAAKILAQDMYNQLRIYFKKQ